MRQAENCRREQLIKGLSERSFEMGERYGLLIGRGGRVPWERRQQKEVSDY